MSSEFDLIDAFLAPFKRGKGVVIGPGSDCAAVEPARGLRLVATTDAVVEGVHFDLRRFSPEDVGWKALAVNLSDLAAAGREAALVPLRPGGSAQAAGRGDRAAHRPGDGGRWRRSPGAR